MDPAYLASLTSIAKNITVYKPHWKAILKLYCNKYTKTGKADKLDEEEMLLEELLRLEAEGVAADSDCDSDE